MAIAVLWLIRLVLLSRAGRGLPMREGGGAPDRQPERTGMDRASAIAVYVIDLAVPASLASVAWARPSAASASAVRARSRSQMWAGSVS